MSEPINPNDFDILAHLLLVASLESNHPTHVLPWFIAPHSSCKQSRPLLLVFCCVTGDPCQWHDSRSTTVSDVTSMPPDSISFVSSPLAYNLYNSSLKQGPCRSFPIFHCWPPPILSPQRDYHFLACMVTCSASTTTECRYLLLPCNTVSSDFVITTRFSLRLYCNSDPHRTSYRMR